MSEEIKDHQLLEEPGKYLVRIQEPVFREMGEKDGDGCRFELELPGVSTVKGESGADLAVYQVGHLYFTRKIIQGGQNAGKTMFDVSAAKCVELGMSEPFHPDKLRELEDKQALFTVETETYEGRTRAKVAFVNAPGAARPALSAEKVGDLWKQMQSGTGAPVTAVAPASEDLPF